ncbi:MAG: sulfurase [Rhodobacteraceae bacterium]|nr:sulfurase [Paracoccaceae bacterium]
MPALRQTDHIARITFLGINADRGKTLRNQSAEAVEVGFDGFQGESRAGLTRPSCSRVVDLYPRGTEIRNTRQISIVSAEELAIIAEKMGVDAVDPVWISAGMVLEGIADLSHLPPGSRLQAPNGTTLTIDVENRPCHLPAKVIEEDMPGKGAAFKLAAKGLRGVTAWVERPGALAVGNRMTLFVPDQPAWNPQGAFQAETP